VRDSGGGGGWTTLRLRVDSADDDDYVGERVYVAVITDTNLLLVVVDGHRGTVATTVGNTQRQVYDDFIVAANAVTSSFRVEFTHL